MLLGQVIPNSLYTNQIKNFRVVFSCILNIKFRLEKNKLNINKFFNFYKFVTIYFFIGNFFIKNKLKKTIKNLVKISSNYYQVSELSVSNFFNILDLLRDIKINNFSNFNKSIFYLNSRYYIPKTILKNNFSYFNILKMYLIKIKLNLNYMYVYLLKLFYFFNVHCKIKKNNFYFIKN